MAGKGMAQHVGGKSLRREASLKGQFFEKLSHPLTSEVSLFSFRGKQNGIFVSDKGKEMFAYL